MGVELLLLLMKKVKAIKSKEVSADKAIFEKGGEITTLKGKANITVGTPSQTGMRGETNLTIKSKIDRTNTTTKIALVNNATNNDNAEKNISVTFQGAGKSTIESISFGTGSHNLATFENGNNTLASFSGKGNFTVGATAQGAKLTFANTITEDTARTIQTANMFKRNICQSFYCLCKSCSNSTRIKAKR